ncbi:hypothetical protein ACMAUO_20640 [Gluconacetobacter sp. Hr-1-5]|uniref:hypothetical protein n=1 Tax=Gluconacetobacter sp. Hr-1-5 TaxID=3395370 RepID=UPI003B52CC21
MAIIDGQIVDVIAEPHETAVERGVTRNPRCGGISDRGEIGNAAEIHIIRQRIKTGRGNRFQLGRSPDQSERIAINAEGTAVLGRVSEGRGIEIDALCGHGDGPATLNGDVAVKIDLAICGQRERSSAVP